MTCRCKYFLIFLRAIAVMTVIGILGSGGDRVMAAAPVDASLYAELLSQHLRNGAVSYAGLKADEARLDRYLKQLEQADPEAMGRDDQFAFYINAYNAWTIKLILTGYPGVKSIKDLGSLLQSPWKKQFVRIAGKTASLDDIEHGLLRPRFKDPRVHFAINCASKSCPPLLSEPYRGEILDAQLTRATRDFLNDPVNYRLEGNRFWVSSIFKWFAEDFKGDVIGFYRQQAQGALKARLEADRDRIELHYLDYDWSLNGS
jgi:hypothetical protein